MDTQKVDLLLQYALAIAGESEDYQDRELGPIHLLKYAYLADLAHAQSEGQSYTGAPWRFHKFGPWAMEVYERITPAAQAIQGIERRFSSRFKDQDAVRWRVQSSKAAEDLERKLPWPAARAIRQAVQKYHNDTTALLHYTYQTAPMLKAAPGEFLELTPSSAEGDSEAIVPESSPLPALSRSKVKQLQALVKSRALEKSNRDLVMPDPAPRYDEVFAKGEEWLDHQAGDPIQPERGRIRFANNVWKSPGRRDPEFP